MATKSKKKKLQGGVQFRDDGTIFVKNVRLSYEHLFQKYAGNDGDSLRYSAVFILPNETHSKVIKQINEHIHELAADEIDGKVKRDNFFLRNGDDSGKDEYEDAWTINAADSKRRPTVVNRDKSPITEEDGIVYSGCWVNLLIRPWAQDNKFGKRINANLLMVQFVADDEAFSGSSVPDADDVFEDLEDAEFDDADERPRKKSKRRDDDEDDERPSKKPSKRKPRDEEEEEDEDERPRKKRRDDDDDDDDRPSKSKKRRSRDEEEEEEEEEEERPRKKSSKVSKSSGKKRRPRDDDDDDEF